MNTYKYSVLCPSVSQILGCAACTKVMPGELSCLEERLGYTYYTQSTSSVGTYFLEDRGGSCYYVANLQPASRFTLYY